MSEHIIIFINTDIFQHLFQNFPVNFFICFSIKDLSVCDIQFMCGMYGSNHKIKWIFFYKFPVKRFQIRLKSDFYTDPYINLIFVFVPQRRHYFKIFFRLKHFFRSPCKIIFVVVIRKTDCLKPFGYRTKDHLLRCGF